VKNKEHIINILNYIVDKGLLVMCCGTKDYLFYNFDRDEWRVYNTTFKLDQIEEVVIKMSGLVAIELKAG